MPELLIVDDEVPVLKLLQRFLESAGYTCRSVENVADAKSSLADHDFQLILSDLSMPGASGYDLIHHVKEARSDIPIIVVSATDNPEKAKVALELGVYGYIVKPFTRNIVLINVENALLRKRLEVENKAYLTKLEALVEERTQSLHNQLAFSKTLMDAIPSPIFYKNRAGEFKGCNSAFEELIGRKRESIVGRTVHDIAPKLQAEISSQTDRQLIHSPGKVAYEYDVTYPDGTIHNFLINKATFLDGNGDIAGLAAVMVDITQRKAAEAAQRLSEEKFRNIVENIGIGVALIGSDARVLEVNRQMREWFPDVEPGSGTPCYKLFIGDSKTAPCHGCPTMQALKTGRVCEATLGFSEPLNKHCFRIIASPIRDHGGKISSAIELVEDISEKNALERELRQAQKLEAIGQLAAGIAHEINTPIQYVGDNVRFLEDAFEDIQPVMKAYANLLAAVKADAVDNGLIETAQRAIENADLPYLSTEVPGAIEQSLEGIQRVSKIIQAMRQFSHPGTDRKTVVDINQALENTITVARNEWKYVADLETDFDHGIKGVHCLPGEMNQVFLNLIVNAAHAIGDSTDGGKKGKGKIRVSTRAMGNLAQIRIEDTGGGIPESIQQRIFDPFFTTKPVGKGTGQGLSIAHNVITEKHAGTINFETEAGQGTTFIIEIPMDPVERTSA